MDVLGAKHETLRILVAAVLRHVPAKELLILDWCDGDPHALAFAIRSDPERRAYVSNPPGFNGQYLLSCENTARLDMSLRHNIEADPFSDVDLLAMAIAQHLGAA